MSFFESMTEFSKSKVNESKLKNRVMQFCSQCCKDSKTVFVLALECSVYDFFSFESNKNSLVKTEGCRFSQKSRH